MVNALSEARRNGEGTVKTNSIEQVLKKRGGKAVRRSSMLFAMFISTAPAFAATNMSVDQMLASSCQSVPGNYALSDFWNSKMNVLGSSCDYPSITEAHINGARKPKAYVDGSSGVSHDVNAIESLNGDGLGSSDLGTAPDTDVTFGTFCSNPTALLDGKPGDVAFSLRVWSENCLLTSDRLPTILVFGENNQNEFVGNTRATRGIQISSGANYGKAIDYFTPGGANTVLGGGNVSYALPEFAGIIVGLNTALISAGKSALSNDTIKAVLDASSDEVYLQVDGFKGIFKESDLNALMSKSGTRYYGQIINLENAIEFVLTGGVTLPTTPPPPPPPPGPEKNSATLLPILALLLGE